LESDIALNVPLGVIRTLMRSLAQAETIAPTTQKEDGSGFQIEPPYSIGSFVAAILKEWSSDNRSLHALRRRRSCCFRMLDGFA